MPAAAALSPTPACVTQSALNSRTQSMHWMYDCRLLTVMLPHASPLGCTAFGGTVTFGQVNGVVITFESVSVEGSSQTSSLFESPPAAQALQMAATFFCSAFLIASTP